MRSLGLVVLFAVALTARFAFLCDDAYISFRYARNLARGAGLAYNPGEALPVEGFSNLGWVLWAALLEGVLLDPTIWVPVGSAAIGALGVVLVFVWGRRHLGLPEPMALLAAALVGWCPAWAVWSTSGLETVPFAVAVLWLFERTVLAPDASVRSVVIAALLVMLLRIEGAGWCALLLGLGALWGPTAPGRRARIGRAALWVLGAFAVYMAWRLWMFGTLAPHTAMVKLAPGPIRLERGLRYVVLFVLTFATPVAALVSLAWVGETRVGRCLAALLAAAGLFAIAAGGDFLPMGRLLVVGIPAGAWLIALALHRLGEAMGPTVSTGVGLLLVVLGILPAGGMSVLPTSLAEDLHFRYTDVQPMSEAERWYRTKENAWSFAIRGRALAERAPVGASMVAPAIGAVGYYSGLVVYDQHGLVTRDVGLRAIEPDEPLRSPGHDKYVDAAWFAPLEPTYLHTKVVYGDRSARKMRDWLERWDVPVALQADYVPDFEEIAVPGRSERHFLLVVRRCEPGEEPATAWRNFFERTRTLSADL